MATKTFSERCHAEATANVVFLFQRRRYIITGLPSGYEADGECVFRGEHFNPAFDKDHGEELTNGDLAKITYGDWDVPCALETWETDRVFLSREEANEFGEAKHYNYPDGWRVYGIPAQGELADLLRDS